MADLKWGDPTWNWSSNTDGNQVDKFGDSNLVQRIRLQATKDLNLEGPGWYSCNGCKKTVIIEPTLSRLVDWVLADTQERLELGFTMSTWSPDDILSFFDTETTGGRVTLIEKLQRTVNELQFLKDDNSRWFNKTRRAQDALENSLTESRKFKRNYNDLLDLSRKLLECPVCLLVPWNLVLKCGHTLCHLCARKLKGNGGKNKCGICSR